MRDDDRRRRAASRLPNAPDDLALCLTVERGGGLVEDEQARLSEKGARDCDTLLLPARKLHAPFSDTGAVKGGQACDELMDMSASRSLLDFLGVVQAVDRDIGGDAVVQKQGVLRHDGDRLSESHRRHLVDRNPVEQDPTAVRLQEPD